MVVTRVLRASIRSVDRCKHILLCRKPYTLLFSSSIRAASLLRTNVNRTLHCHRIGDLTIPRSFCSTNRPYKPSDRPPRTYSGRQTPTSFHAHQPQLSDTLKEEYEAFMNQPSVEGAQQLIQKCGFNQLPLAWEVYRTLLKSGQTPTTQLIALLAKYSTAARQSDKSIPFLWDELTRFSLPITEDCIPIFANACRKVGDHNIATQLLSYAKERPRELLRNPIVSLHLCAAFRAGNRLDKALELLQLTEQINLPPEQFPYKILFSICGDVRNLQEGKRLHKRLIDQQVELDYQVVTALITMYSRCGKLDEAIAVFKPSADRFDGNVCIWNAMLTAYRDHHQIDKVFQLFNDMTSKGLTPDDTTITVLLSACNTAPRENINMDRVKQLHGLVMTHSIPMSNAIVSALITSYCKGGLLHDAEAVFNTSMRHNKGDASVWTAMINGYAMNKQGAKAMETFNNMIRAGVKPNAITMTAVLNGCAKGGLVDEALSLFYTMEKKYGITPGSLHATCVVVALVDAEKYGELLHFYTQLPKLEKDVVRYPFSKCNNIQVVDKVYSLALERHIHLDYIAVIALIENYMRHGMLDKAYDVFNRHKDTHGYVNVWTAMINGYAVKGHGAKAVQIFNDMVQEGVKPDEIAMTAVLNGCAKGGLVNEALSLFYSMEKKYGLTPASPHVACVAMALVDAERYEEMLQFLTQLPVISETIINYTFAKCNELHVIDKVYSIAQQHCIRLDHMAVTTLVDTYSRHGLLDKAHELFNRHSETHHNVGVWNAMINGYAINGRGVKAIETFHAMIREGVKPNVITMTAVLNGCAKSGLVDEALSLFRSMETNYGIRPDEMHQHCIKHALIQDGRIEEARQIEITNETR